MDNRVATRSRKTFSSTENIDDGSSQGNASRSSSPVHDSHEEDQTEDASLRSILNELKDFRRDNKQQLKEIKQELSKTNNRLEAAEDRIEEAETALGAAATMIKRLTQRQAAIEAKMLDQEARARRENIRIYGIPEDAEGNNMTGFLENLLRDSLDFPQETELRIERAHRALAPKSTSPQAKPRSIVAKLGSYRLKEEVIRRAWQKKQVFHNGTRFYVDHDYPSTILKQRSEYAEVKKVLKEKNVKFQTPFPAKLRVFYNDGTRVYQSAAEATEDMVTRGFTVNIIPRTSNPDQREMERLSVWQEVGDRHASVPTRTDTQPQEKTASRPLYKDKLQEFRRRSPQK